MATAGGGEITPGETATCIAAAQQGQAEPLGRALEACRDYLMLMAGRGLGADLTAKVGASDLVQETFLAARRDFAAFRGRTPEELRGWLRAILLNLLANTRRHYRGAGKRRVDHEVPLTPGGPASGPGPALAGSTTSPSGAVMRHEREAALRAAVDGLPEHYRQVVCWHHQEGRTFEEIAGRLGGSAEAARKVWGRALVRLSEVLGPGHDPR